MQQPHLHILQGQHLWLTHQKFIFWEEHQAIILSDLHIGKTTHFRKHGIALSPNIFKEDLQTLFHGITHFKAKQVIAVGDLFHSYNNNEHSIFLRWLQDAPLQQFHLIKGNHDVLGNSWYTQNGIELHTKEFTLNNFSFIHNAEDITEKEPTSNYFFTGHLHPGITIKTGSKQSMRLPCYWFRKNYMVLPAFGNFTGLANIKPTKADKVFAITPTSVIKL